MSAARVPTILPLLTTVICVAGMLGCGVQVCEAETPPAPFADVVGDFPSEAVFCKDGIQPRAEFPAVGDSWPQASLLPNESDLNFDLPTLGDALTKLKDHLDSKGWKQINQEIGGEESGFSVAFAKDGRFLDFYIETTKATNPLQKRIRAVVHLTEAPCEKYVREIASGCVDKTTAVTCINGVRTETIDCGATNQTCASADRVGACVSELCLASAVGTGQWSAEDCPAELVGAGG